MSLLETLERRIVGLVGNFRIHYQEIGQWFKNNVNPLKTKRVCFI
jgi:hypothetical protein